MAVIDPNLLAIINRYKLKPRKTSTKRVTPLQHRQHTVKLRGLQKNVDPADPLRRIRHTPPGQRQPTKTVEALTIHWKETQEDGEVCTQRAKIQSTLPMQQLLCLHRQLGTSHRVHAPQSNAPLAWLVQKVLPEDLQQILVESGCPPRSGKVDHWRGGCWAARTVEDLSKIYRH